VACTKGERVCLGYTSPNPKGLPRLARPKKPDKLSIATPQPASLQACELDPIPKTDSSTDDEHNAEQDFDNPVYPFESNGFWTSLSVNSALTATSLTQTMDKSHGDGLPVEGLLCQ
jgi:hypothetical protein